MFSYQLISSFQFIACPVLNRWVHLLCYKVEPNQEFHGLVCEGASVLPSKFLEDAFRDGYGRLSFKKSQFLIKLR